MQFVMNKLIRTEGKWLLGAVLLVILLVASVFLFREQPGNLPADKARESKIRESTTPVKKENETQEQFDYRVAASRASNGIKIKKNEKGLWEMDCGDGIILVYIPPGKFIMGADDYEDYERPAHEVYLDGYWMGKYTITFDQYEKFCTETSRDSNDISDAGWGRGKRPVISVSWYDANDYCKWLSSKTGLNFKLPTEAQWEKAARGTNGQIYPWGNQDADENLANFGDDKKDGKTYPVGSYPLSASPYGIMEMAGNVWEWCSDWYGNYSGGPQKNPTGPQSGISRVLRGGSWFDSPRYIRCSNRYYTKPSYRGYAVGFRLCQEN
jgi:formylglycine-generating enzyme required for sulfatase activity